MPKNGWFHSHNQNFDVENEAHRKVDDYPHSDHPDDQLKLFIFWQNWKMITVKHRVKCSKFDSASKITKPVWYFWCSVKLLIGHQIFDIPLIFFIAVSYMVNNIDKSHIFGQ